MFTIYKASHSPSGLFYIGRTSKPLIVRIGQHWADTDRSQVKFHSFLKNSDVDDWTWQVLAEVQSYSESVDAEMYFIEQTDAYEKGLNSKAGMGSSEELLEKHLPRIKKQGFQKNHATWNKGRKGVYSEKTLELMRLAKEKNPSRQVHTPESRAKKADEATNKKQIMELGTGEVFASINDAVKKTGLRRESIRDVVNGRRNHTSGRIFVAVNGRSDEELKAFKTKAQIEAAKKRMGVTDQEFDAWLKQVVTHMGIKI